MTDTKQVDYSYDPDRGSLRITLNGTFDSIRFDDKGVMHVGDEDAVFTYNGKMVSREEPSTPSEPQFMKIGKYYDDARKENVSPFDIEYDDIPWATRVQMARNTRWLERSIEEKRPQPTQPRGVSIVDQVMMAILLVFTIAVLVTTIAFI